MTLPINQIINKDWIEAAKELPDQSVHCIITSPPYWGQRNYGVEGQLGLEKTPEEHIEKLVAGFRELRRVLRDDGTLWVNYGDKYAANRHTGDYGLSARHKEEKRPDDGSCVPDGNQLGDLLGLAWRLALALQADGWILRSDIIWAKGLSFCDSYSGSVMPESVNGWRWERCRVKVKQRPSRIKPSGAGDNMIRVPGCENGNTRLDMALSAQYRDCPGCLKCEKNGGYVLRRGSWRPTKGHE